MNARLDARQAITLYEIGKMVAASLGLDATLEAVSDAAQHLTGAHSIALALLEWDGRLVVRVGRGPVVASVGQELPLDRGITAQAIRQGEPVLIADMLCEPQRARPDLDAQYGVRTFLAAPLIWREETLGVLTVAFDQPDAVDPALACLVQELAQQAAVAVAHARDYAEEQRLRAESEEINRQFVEQTLQLERAQQHLIQNEKLTAIGQLVQGLAHEMNTPLSVLMANLSVLERHGAELAGIAQAAQTVVPQLSADPLAAALAAPLQSALTAAGDLDYTLEDLPALLDESAAAARRLADLVRSVATFARREASGPTRVSIEEVLEAAVNVAWNALKNRATVSREYATIPPVLGQTAELSEVFLHLLMNAAQALEDAPGTVSLSIQRDGPWALVHIQDTGRGIPAEHLPRVFDPFFTTRPPGHGTGMGLSVCYGIVQRHGGSIAIDSRPGLGTTVSVRLPLADADDAQEAMAA